MKKKTAEARRLTILKGRGAAALTSVEICAGAGGQALGLEQAGFNHQALVEIDDPACRTLSLNRPSWHVLPLDIRHFDGRSYRDVNLLAGGVPCPPFSKAGKQLGSEDERDLFPHAIRLIEEIRPQAVMLENVRGFLDAIFDEYRAKLKRDLAKLGYDSEWQLLNASGFGVSQLRPRIIFIACRKNVFEHFRWPHPSMVLPPTVGEILFDLMVEKGWRGATAWRRAANEIAPTLVGGSKKHGGPDLGPTRARRAWAALGVDGKSLAEEAPERDFVGMPKLTVRMAARLQGFPDEWHIYGKKTPAYRQVGNAFPPPVAKAVGTEIQRAILKSSRARLKAVSIGGGPV